MDKLKAKFWPLLTSEGLSPLGHGLLTILITTIGYLLGGWLPVFFGGVLTALLGAWWGYGAGLSFYFRREIFDIRDHWRTFRADDDLGWKWFGLKLMDGWLDSVFPIVLGRVWIDALVWMWGPGLLV